MYSLVRQGLWENVEFQTKQVQRKWIVGVVGASTENPNNWRWCQVSEEVEGSRRQGPAEVMETLRHWLTAFTAKTMNTTSAAQTKGFNFHPNFPNSVEQSWRETVRTEMRLSPLNRVVLEIHFQRELVQTPLGMTKCSPIGLKESWKLKLSNQCSQLHETS